MTAAVGAALSAVGAAGYDLPPGYVALVFLATAFGGAMFVAAARFQRQQRFAQSLVLVQSPNFSLIAAAIVALAIHDSTAGMALAITTTGYLLPAVWGWLILLRERRQRVPGVETFPWREAAAIMALNGSGLVLVQLDRLVIPHLLPLEELAPFGVLAAIVGSLFRVLQMGVTFSLVPRLAAAADVPARRRLMAGEARLVFMAVVVGSVAIWVVTEPVERYLLAGKYHLSDALILSAIAAGVAKTLNAFSIATVTVLADRRELTLVNVWGWLSVAISVAAAAALAPWGLVGVVYGVGLGWLVRAVTGLAITVRHLRESPGPAPSLSV